MKTKDLKDLITNVISTNESSDLNLIPCIWGKTGIGKTEVVKQVLTELGYKMAYVTVGNMEDVGDLVGLPHIVDGEMQYATPDWFPKEGKTVIFLDEINRSKPQIRQALFPLLNQKRIMNTILPPNCHFIAAGNPSTDEYETDDISDRAFLSRFVHVEFQPTTFEWSKYTKKVGGSKSLINFISNNDAYIGTKVKGFDVTTLVEPDRRKATTYSIFMDACKCERTNKLVGYGMLGVVFMEQYYAHLKETRKMIDGVKLLNSPEESDFANLEANREEIDLVHKAMTEILDTLPESQEMSKNQAENLLRVFKIIPLDLISHYYIEIVKKTMSSTFLDIVCDDEELVKSVTERASEKVEA